MATGGDKSDQGWQFGSFSGGSELRNGGSGLDLRQRVSCNVPVVCQSQTGAESTARKVSLKVFTELSELY